MPPLQPDNLNIRFAAISGVGTIHHLFRDTMRLANKGACMAVILLSALMLNRHLAEMACGPFRVPILHHSRFDNNAGILIGLICLETLIIWNYPAINPWLRCSLSLLVAGLMGYASWSMIEKPCLQLKVMIRAQ
jgi:hypothetical protein